MIKNLTILLLLFVLIPGCQTGKTRYQRRNVNDKLIDILTPIIQSRTVLNLEPSNNLDESQFSSHFGGLPYFEKGESWPVNRKTNKPLSFIIQIVNNGNINLPKEIGILQFYYDWEEMPWETESEGWLVKLYPKADKEKAIIIYPDTSIIQTSFCLIRYTQDKSLPDWEGIDNYYKNVTGLSEKGNPDEPWEPFDNAVNKLVGEHDFNSFIGGYPMWIQGDETPIINDIKYKLLCQINSEEAANIIWGDMGAVYFFYNPNNPTDIKFTLQCF
jgi:uncharacterized protein YwqG